MTKFGAREAIVPAFSTNGAGRGPELMTSIDDLLALEGKHATPVPMPGKGRSSVSIRAETASERMRKIPQ